MCQRGRTNDLELFGSRWATRADLADESCPNIHPTDTDLQLLDEKLGDGSGSASLKNGG